MVFDTTFDNISVISWPVPKENQQPVGSHCQTLSDYVILSAPRNERGLN